MAIFNSLGSNYNLKYVLESLFSDTDQKNQKLKNLLEEKYQGKTILTYKGRGALTLALKILYLSKESCVAINGFTCFAVYKAIEKAGCKPILIDIPRDDLNLTRSDLVSTLTKNPDI